MEYQQDKNSQLHEFSQWQDIIHSEGWRCYLKALQSHKAYLQVQANGYLRKHEDRRAAEELAKMDDCEKIVNLIKTRISELRTKTEGEK